MLVEPGSTVVLTAACAQVTSYGGRCGAVWQIEVALPRRRVSVNSASAATLSGHHGGMHCLCGYRQGA